MKYHILASGSKGNACLIQSQGINLLIDCGMTQKYLKAGFIDLGVDYYEFDALLITHDHSDHTKQLRMFRHLPIYSPSEIAYEYELVVPYESFEIHHLKITPLKTSHDAEYSVGYVIEDGVTKLIYMTDTGYIRESDYEYLKGADHYILESNHDPELLMQTNRPYYLKQRILSDTGHLSNDKAGRVLAQVVAKNTKSITLAHMSLEANTEAVVLDTIVKHLEHIDHQDIVIQVAKQFEIVSGGNINEIK